jgi:hypothetical protein
MRTLFYEHSAAMAYIKFESIDWQLKMAGRRRRRIGKAELKRRLLKDLARKREA